MGDDPLNSPGPGVLPGYGGATDYGTATTSESGKKMELNLLGGDNAGSGI